MKYCALAARPVCASQIGVSVFTDCFVAEVWKNVLSFRPCHVVVPLFWPAVYEDAIWCEVIIVADDIAQIGACFVAFSGVWDEEMLISLLVQAVDIRYAFAVVAGLAGLGPKFR